MSTTPQHAVPDDRPARPPQGTPEELEATQRWWLTWIYVPIMAVIGIAALVTGIAGTGDRELSLILACLTGGGLLGAFVRFRGQHGATGRIALDERDETANMRMLGYGFCFAFFGALAWSVVWAATNTGGVPAPLLATAGLVVCMGLGRLCTRREGF